MFITLNCSKDKKFERDTPKIRPNNLNKFHNWIDDVLGLKSLDPKNIKQTKKCINAWKAESQFFLSWQHRKTPFFFFWNAQQLLAKATGGCRSRLAFCNSTSASSSLLDLNEASVKTRNDVFLF